MTYSEIKKQIQEKFSTEIDFSDDQNLLEIGLNSIQVVRIVNDWRKEGYKVSFGTLMENPTLGAWQKLLEKSKNTKRKKASKKTIQNLDTSQETFPLTDVQYAYWIGRSDDQPLGGVGCHAYLEFDGRIVNTDRLKKAWKTVQMHHPMLRAKFLDPGMQCIMDKPYSEELPVNDLRNLESKEREDALEKIRERLGNRRLDVDAGQVAGVELTRIHEDKTRLHVDMDLMIADVQSLQILLRDLMTAYSGKRLPEASRNWSFANYLKSISEEDKEELEKAKAYWQDRLDTLPTGPELPLLNRPEHIEKTRFKRRLTRFDAEEWEAMQTLSASYKTTPAMMLLTAYAVLLERWSGTKQFLINIPLFNRKTEKLGLEDAIADFTTLLLLEVDLRDNPDFLTLLERIQEQFHSDMQHTAYSGVQIQRDLSQRKGGHFDAAPIVFACNLGIPLTDKEFNETLGAFSYMTSQTPQVWLDFQTYESDEGLMLTWDTVDALFPENMVDDMFSAFKGLLHRLLKEDWQQRMDILPQNQLKFLKNERIIPPLAVSQCLHTAFLESAEAFPQNIALIDTGKGIRMSYKVLAEQAKSVAAGLVNRDIREKAIAITINRGYEQIVGVLGILISGNHYVPVSLDQPKDRRERIHEKTNIEYVITNEASIDGIDWPEYSEVFTLEALSQTPHLKSYPEVIPQETAYIIMTSGSTGLPKGVEIAHYSAWNTVDDINKRHHVNEKDAVLCVSAMDFDLSVYDVFGLLGVGGRLVLIPDDERKNPDYWLQVIEKEQVSLWNSVPILLEMLLVVANAYKAKDLPLRLALLSGDWIPMDLPEKWFSQVKDADLISMGGATEASIWSNHQEVTVPLPKDWKSIPYGRPLRGQAYRVVDSFGRDCPYWLPGELLIGGHGVALGYRGDEMLTQNKFTTEYNVRWYHTGDMGRIWSDGTIEFLGRKDYQVKVRGHRIELGEIEAAIGQIPSVKDTIVSAIGKDPRKKALVGVVVTEDSTLTESNLKTILGEKVPEYMIPSRILFMDKFSVTGNGKRDRKQVEQWIVTKLENKKVDSRPQTQEEELIYSIWKDLFGRDNFGMEDNYFELGGDSLLGTKMIAKINEEMHCNVSVRHLFEHSTIRELTRKINQLKNEVIQESLSTKIALCPAEAYMDFPTTEIQYAYWVGRKNIYTLGNVSAYCYYELEAQNLDIERLNATWNHLVQKHAALRLAFSNDGRSQKVLQDVPEYTFQIEDLAGISEEAQELKLLETRSHMAQQVLDTSDWPLFDIRVSNCNGSRQVVHVGMDIIIMDARSVLSLLKEWTQSYLNGAVEPIEFHQPSFRDYVLTLKALEKTMEYKRDNKYWMDRIDQFPTGPCVPLKTKPEDVEQQIFRRIEQQVDKTLWSQIKDIARSYKLTPSSVLLSIYAWILKEFSEDSHFALNITFDKRMFFKEALESVIGDFTSTLLLEVDMRNGSGFIGFAKHMQDQLSQDMQHSRFSGLDFQRMLLKERGKAFEYGVPVVFTSTLGMENDTKNLFGQVRYNITQTPQVWIDFQIQEIGSNLYLNIDYVEGLVEESVVKDMMNLYMNGLKMFISEQDFVVSEEVVYQEGLI